uniref:BRCT domain-containing protein n=1 Tax=Lygus hesperus TaxID=30085 RepID=A0A0A9XP15_LYGHE
MAEILVSRKYVQPQWIFDSFNERFQLPLEYYAPGKKLPPHLSPFVDDYATGYIPEQRKQIEQWAQKMAPHLVALSRGGVVAGSAEDAAREERRKGLGTYDVDLSESYSELSDGDGNQDTKPWTSKSRAKGR